MKQKTYDLIVSLGGNCAVANQLKYRNMRPFSLPLDYVFMADEKPIKYLCEAFENDFKNFCLKENLIELQGSERGDDRAGNMQYKDLYSEFRFIHHFHCSIEEEGVYESVKETLNRRIDRLFNEIETNKNILFILNTNFTFDVELVKNLYKIITTRWNKKKISFLIIQFGATESKSMKIENFGTVVFYNRKMNAEDFNNINLTEWKILNEIKLKKFKNLVDKYKYKIWVHLGKELKRKGIIK